MTPYFVNCSLIVTFLTNYSLILLKFEVFPDCFVTNSVKRSIFFPLYIFHFSFSIYKLASTFISSHRFAPMPIVFPATCPITVSIINQIAVQIIFTMCESTI